MNSYLLNCLFILIFGAYINAEYNCQYKKDGFYTDLEFCHIYWRCNYGVPEEYECPAGTAWNHIELRCDWLDNVDCTRGGTITQKPEETEAPETEEPEEESEETEEPETEELEPTTTVKSTKKEKTKQTTTEEVVEEKNTADNLSSIESTGPKIVAMGLVGDPKPTESVLINSEPEAFISEIQTTNENLTLDSESQSSVPESLALSSESASLESLEVLITETQQPTNELLVQTTVPATTKKIKTTKKISTMEERKHFEYDTLCNGLLASTGFVSDPFICNKYLRCNHGVAERFTCATGTLWNSKDKMCTWPTLVDCDDREIFTDSELVKEEQGISISAEVSDEDDEEDDEDDEDEESSTESKGASKESKPSKELSAQAAAISSSKEQTSSETSSEGTDDSAAETSSESKDNKNKSRFSTRPLLTRKNVKESTVTSTIATTSSSSQATVTNSTSSVCHSVGTYNLPDNTNCATYIVCNMGKESHATCPEKQLFNIETAQCEDFQLVFCGLRPVNHADKNQCASKRDGIYPDIERACRIFYQCVSQQKVREATCPNNLKFNTMTGRCDNPANVLPPCGTYNVTLGTGSNTSGSVSINRLINWSKYLLTLLATKLTILRLI